jgi:hypothetical protein
MKASDLSRLVTARTERRPIALVTDLGSHEQALFEAGNEAQSLSLSPAQRDAVAEALAANRSGEIDWMRATNSLRRSRLASVSRSTAWSDFFLGAGRVSSTDARSVPG